MKKFNLILVILIILSISLAVALPPPPPGPGDDGADAGTDDGLLPPPPPPPVDDVTDDTPLPPETNLESGGNSGESGSSTGTSIPPTFVYQPEVEDIVEPSVSDTIDTTVFVEQDFVSLQNSVNTLNVEVQSLQSRILDLESELSASVSKSSMVLPVNSILIYLFILGVLILVILMFFYFKAQIHPKFSAKSPLVVLKQHDVLPKSKKIKQDNALKDIVLKYLNSGMSESSIRTVLKKTGVTKEEIESVFLDLK